MKDQRACISFEQKVFRAPAGSSDCGACHGSNHGEVHGPSQASIMDSQARDAPAGHMRLDAAARGFDFG
jgi:hypothetical protein